MLISIGRFPNAVIEVTNAQISVANFSQKMEQNDRIHSARYCHEIRNILA